MSKLQKMNNPVMDRANASVHPIKKLAKLCYIRSIYPLWLCWVIAILMRVYLVTHTHGVIDGDEALVGIQAQHILSGERPIYFYGQAYMGSLEAYLVAVVFLLVGSSVWTLRAEPILLTLVLIWLTWRLAHVLAERASFSPYTRLCFTWISTLLAAIMPVYDMVSEMHVLGGYIETFIIMLLLLLSAVSLVDRWQAGASNTEIALRWAGIGWLIGLGLWIDPLVIYAIVAIIIWIAYGIFKMWHRTPELLLVLVALPTTLLGSAPALYWGLSHHWENISYIIQRGPNSLLSQPVRVWNMVGFYGSCIAPRVMGGAMPIEGATEAALSQCTLYVVLVCIGATIAMCVASYVIRCSLLLQMRRVAALPLLFGFSTVIIFCTSARAMAGLLLACVSDPVGRYASPILLVIPFFIAVTISSITTFLHDKLQEHQLARKFCQDGDYRRSALWYDGTRSLQCGVVVLLLLYLGVQVYTYYISDAGYTFQSPFCQIAPANSDPLIAYMERQHIRYAWATNIVANVLTFKTQGQIMAIDPSGVVDHDPFVNRLPAYTHAVQHADRPSMLQLVASSNIHPRVLRNLDQEHISYTVARFPAEPGVDILVVTPLNRTAPVMSAPAFHAMFRCQLN